jgi:hypothetical protein
MYLEVAQRYGSKTNKRGLIEKYLNRANLEKVSILKQKLLDNLEKMGHICKNFKCKYVNVKSSKRSLVKLCICAGFDQNVARICKLSGTIKSQQKDQLSIGMASVLHEHPCKNIAAIRGFPNELLVYEEKINCGDSSLRLQNCTIVNPTFQSPFKIKVITGHLEATDFGQKLKDAQQMAADALLESLLADFNVPNSEQMECDDNGTSNPVESHNEFCSQFKFTVVYKSGPETGPARSRTHHEKCLG